ncbi:tyrosine--tRNA ligase [Fictibacillus nanhaiensis]|uniref:tyrosine--tRNA ligase n=1 Tax=Fictibacillus nanhaiensis TaxID=742169 RepID=UPI001C97C20F|nr:tyrosine--tRNA ligase [Fictibacillus nanhaiensis]MBY6035169.1 tyrosine--tRNA ligase [Fictibacillus nanhaiensis]
MNILQDLEFRGLLHQVTDQEGLTKELESGKVTLYCGFDPTADSLHIGNLLVIITLKRFQEAGHQPLALVGGGTGLIGDPSGRQSERTLNEAEIVGQWTEKIKHQLSKLLDFESKTNPAKTVNNYEWLSELTVIEFLRDVGKNFSINYMLAKDSVDSRLEGGISFTEFSYMILQSYDFLNLYKQEGCKLQIGGSDQWGNITAGMELIRRSGEEDKAYGLTIPLITKADGTKFGKTASGTIWLDEEKTTPYEFYQFWVNAADADVINWLKYFTFLSQEEIQSLEQSLAESPEKREAQKALGREVTTLVHGEKAYKQAVKITEALFSGNLTELTADEIEQGFKDVPSFSVENGADINIVDLLVEANISPSKRQAREDVTNGAVSVNGEKVLDLAYTIDAKDRIENRFVIFRRGKKKYTLIRY